MLLQKQFEDLKWHPVYYFSRKTTESESKYTSYELEILAVINALKKFRVYLLGMKFKIITDCQAFEKTLQKKELLPRVARWVLLLQDYDYQIEHRKGDKMKHVDCLSRNVLVIESEMTIRLKKAQENDEEIQLISRILDKEPYNDFYKKNNLVYKIENGEKLLMLPRKMQTDIIKSNHEIGHFSGKKVEELIKREFWFKNMKTKIKKYIENCIQCILASRKSGKREGFLNVIDKGEMPLETFHVDHLGPLPSTSKNYKYVFAVIDGFTKFVWLFATKTVTSTETVGKLKIIQSGFGNPREIISDRGTAFTGEEFKAYCKEEKIVHIQITTGVPRSNGQIEVINRIIIPCLAKLSADNPEQCFKHVERVQKSLNSTFQRAIGRTPFEVMIGKKMRLKSDSEVQQVIVEELMNNYSEQREQLRKEAKMQIMKIQDENKKTYNKRRKKAKEYKEGDLVAIKRTQFGAGLKLRAKYLGPYRITKCKRNERYNVEKIGDHEGPHKSSTCSEYIKPWAGEWYDEIDSSEAEE